jgi:hypothetical protein
MKDKSATRKLNQGSQGKGNQGCEMHSWLRNVLKIYFSILLYFIILLQLIYLKFHLICIFVDEASSINREHPMKY